MFQPTWSQEAHAQPPLHLHTQDGTPHSQETHVPHQIQYDLSQNAHHASTSANQLSAFGASISEDPHALPPDPSTYPFSFQQQQQQQQQPHQYHSHHNPHQPHNDPAFLLPQQHNRFQHQASTSADLSAGRPASMQSDASLYVDQHNMVVDDSNPELAGQHSTPQNSTDYLSQHDGQSLSRPPTGSEQSWSSHVSASNEADRDAASATVSTGLQRAARPAALKIDMAPAASGGVHDLPGSTGDDSLSTGTGSAATPHALQTRFAPLPQLQPSMYDEHAVLQQQSATTMHDASLTAGSALMPAFGTESTYLSQDSASKSPASVLQGSDHGRNSPHINQAEAFVGMPGVPERLGPSSAHLGVNASPSSPLMSQFSAGHYSPSSTLSGAFSSRPGSRPASRGLKSVASFTSSAGTGTGTGSGSEAQLGSRPRSSSGSGAAVRPISGLTRTTSMQNEILSFQSASPHLGLSQSRSVQNLGQMQSPGMPGPLSSPRHSGAGGMEPWSPTHSHMAQSQGFRGPYSGHGFQTPQMQQFSPTLTSPAQSQYSPQTHFGSHSSSMTPFFSPSIEAVQQFGTPGGHPADGFDIAGFSEQRLSSALATSASISGGPASTAHQREGHSTPTILEEEEDASQSDGRAMASRSAPTFDSGFPSHHALQQLQHQHTHPHQLQHQHPVHQQQQPQQHSHFPSGQIPPVLQRSRSDQIHSLPLDASSTFRNNQMSYPPHMRPSLYQQVSMAEMNQLRQVHGLGVAERNFGDCSAFIEDYVRQYISTPSRLGLGERNVLIMTTRVAQKSYGAEKRFLCPPPLVILIGSSWWNACPASTRPSPFAPPGAVDPDQAAPTVLSPPRVTINISGEPGIQDGALEWASSSGRLIDVGNPSSEMAISGRCIGKQLYISDVDEKRRHVEALVAISVPGSSPMDRRLLGTFPSRPIKVISKPSKKRQSSRNTELCVNHGSVISLFHRLRSQTVSTRYLCVSGAPSWFKGSDNQPFLNMNPRDQKGQEPPSCFVAKMSSWDPFIIYLVDPKKRADATPSEPLQPPVKGYPPPPPNALPTTGMTSSQMTIHYNQPIVLQCLNTAVVSPVMVVRKVEKGTTVLGGASAGPAESIAREAFGDPVSQLHKIALEVLEDSPASAPRSSGEASESASPGNSGPFLACLNESVGMHRPSEPRRWTANSSFSVPSTPTTPVTSMNLAAMEGMESSGSYLPMSPTSAAEYAAAQTRYSLSTGRAGGTLMSPSASTSSHDVSAMEPPPSSDGGKVKRPRRVSSSVVVQKERAAAAAAASKNRRRGQSLSIVGIQNQGLSDVEVMRRTGSYATSMASDSSAAGSTAPGAMWSVEVADSDIWTVVGTDIARHSFYVPPQIVGGSQPQTNITDGNIAHLITVPAPAQPITPIPVITNVVAPQRDTRAQPMQAPAGDQRPGLVTILGENFHPNLFVFFGDWKSTHVEVRTRQTIVCAAPPSFDQGLPRGRVPILIVRHDGVIFPTDYHYQC